MEEGSLLIVGLGNPGEKYAKTRHNLGFMVLAMFAKRRGWTFKKGWRIKGELAHGMYNGKRVVLLKPTTFMNLCGPAVRKTASYYKVPLSRSMVVVDDVYVNFGCLRMRTKGSTGGHNGMKSIEEELHSQEYPRLRMGIGPKEGVTVEGKDQYLADYVLERFNSEEESQLSTFLDRGVTLLECWLDNGIETAIHKAGEFRQLIG
ncbi:MAG: aminoacyl-tRNA hydrolase [Chlamydiales bacterium]